MPTSPTGIVLYIMGCVTADFVCMALWLAIFLGLWYAYAPASMRRIFATMDTILLCAE